VEFESAEAAEKAVANKNGTELSKRQIKVELVRDPADRPTRDQGRQGATDQKQDSDKGQDQSGTGNRRPRRRTGFGGGNNKRRFARRGTQPQGKDSPNQSSNTGGNNNTKSAGNNNNNNNSKSSVNQSNDNQNPKRRNRRRNNKRNSNQPQNPPKEKILSKTAIFVANIPFEAKDEDLKNFFKDSNPKSAHVVTTQTGRSRGYGFVDFDNEKDQQNAIQTKNKAKWTTPEKEPREISVSASHSQPKEEPAQSKE
jgi:RNA recognition motif-containing protein